jgi:DNA polymerase-1
MGCKRIYPRLETSVTGQYEKYHITADSVWKIVELFNLDKPKMVTLDSETTGLHIKKDKPFMWVFGWSTPRERRKPGFKGRVFSFPQDPAIMKVVLTLCKQAKVVVGNNIKFDFHMMENVNPWERIMVRLGNVVDTMCLTRLVVEAISDRDGGDKLSLKYLAAKYIDPQAKEFEKAVKRELGRINNERREVLKALLKPFKGWGIGKIEDVFKVKEREAEGGSPMKIYTLERKKRWIEVPEEVYETYKTWMEEYPAATYADVPEDVMIEYIHSDAIYTLELAEMAWPRMLAREQTPIFDMEQRLLPILFAQERVGFPVDMEYLKLSYQKLDDEIMRCYRELWELVGEYFTVGQEKVIMDYFEKVTGTRPTSVDKAYLKKQKGSRVAKLITRLRRLEKWQSTYISRIIEVAEYDGRFYTQFNPYTAVSGRSGSDAQQFPKERILTEEGEAYEDEHGEGSAPQEMEIFYPRRAFIPEGGEYDEIWYFDYSQIELRVQANYTILLGRPDLNLCRAYMPLYCKHYKTGEEYNYRTLAGRKRWNELKEGAPEGSLEDLLKAGWSVWILEDGTPWQPTDVHSETAHNALVVGLGYNCLEKYKSYVHESRPPVDAKSFKEYWRKKGKTFNFMRNYGGGAERAAETLDVPMEVAEALVAGWSASFPEVAYYQRVVINTVRMQGFYANMYGRRYYMSNWYWAYKVGNYNVQGSSADFLKWAMIKLAEFFKKHNLKTKMLANIHDEIQFMKYRGEEWIAPYIKRIMEECDWMMVPVVVEAEATRTNWAEKSHLEVAA